MGGGSAVGGGRSSRATLRLRLVAGMVALAAVGLGLFGVVTTVLYADAQVRQLDQQLQAAMPFVAQELAARAGVSLGPAAPTGPAGPAAGGRAGSGGAATGGSSEVLPSAVPGGGAVGPPAGATGSHPPVVVAPGTFGELVGPRGAVLSHLLVESRSTAEPALPAAVVGRAGFLTTGSVRGSVRWRVDVGRRTAGGFRVVLAVPTTAEESSVHRLELIEAAGGVALLLLLSLGAGLVLGRGLAPLERMAGTARRIAGGQLDERVEVPRPSEVATLGTAFNTMLDEIQAAFAARDATEERLRQFLADASHELRTPLTSIQGFAELLRLGVTDPAQRATAVTRIESEAARMRTLVEDLLLLARLDRTRPAEVRPVDLAVVAADACGDARAAAPDRRIVLDAPAPVVVPGDEDHLRQAVANLMANALLHTPSGTAVDVSVAASDGGGALTVRDHGPGLDDEAMAHAFDRFWRGDPSRRGPGAGLGLAIVAGVLHEHGGTVTATNDPGGGARFRLWLPLVPPPAVGRGAAAPTDDGGAPVPTDERGAPAPTGDGRSAGQEPAGRRSV